MCMPYNSFLGADNFIAHVMIIPTDGYEGIGFKMEYIYPQWRHYGALKYIK